jgi:hypothetical protein
MNRPGTRANVVGVIGLTSSIVCWFNVLYRSSLFELLPTMAAQRESVVIVGILGTISVLFAAIRGSRWWLLALVPSILLFGLLRLH